MNFRQLREATGLTQEAFAMKAGVQQTTVSNIEIGKVRMPFYVTVVKLAAAFGTTTEVVGAAIAETEPAPPLVRVRRKRHRTRRRTRQVTAASAA